MTAEQPKMGEVLLLNKEDWLDMPDVPSPYYIVSREKDARGVASMRTYIHRRTAQGRGLVPTDNVPRQLPESGYPHGYFKFDGPELPASIYAQTVHFFRRIFAKYHSEAEVIITQHRETKEYRLFIPTQSVSHGGVYSIYNPAHIGQEYLVIGTFHSHCDFSSFHSGTDEGDAREFDGLHGTIGFIDRPQPEMSLMYALNKTFFHFKEPFEGVVDTTDLDAAQAPEWWDRYVINEKVTDADRQRLAPYADDASWNAFMGRPKFKTQIPQTRAVTKTDQLVTHKGKSYLDMTPDERVALMRHFFPEDDEQQYDGLLRESMAWNAQRRTWRELDEEDTRRLTGLEDLEIGSLDEDYWEDKLGKEFIDKLFNTELITEADADLAIADPDKSGTPEFWEGRMKNKLFRAVAWLRSQGYDVKVQLHDTRIKTVPGQMSVAEYEGRQTSEKGRSA